MEMLNLMFAVLEKHIFSSEAKTVNDDSASVELTQIGKQINIDEILQACYNEVTTKNGTKLVLSVGKTFLKLKDLILEKNTLLWSK